MSPYTIRWLLAAALLVALVIDAFDGDPVKILGTALLTASALLFASQLPDRSPPARQVMIGLIALSVAVLAYRYFVRHF